MTVGRRRHVILVGGVAVIVAVVVGIVVTRGSDTASNPGAAADIAAAPGAGATGAGTTGAGPTDAGTTTDAAKPYCGASRYVTEITLQQWTDGGFRISVRPTLEARRTEDKDAATAEIWQAVQGCVVGLDRLDGDVGDSLKDQLRCHEYLALVPDPRGDGLYATGETFDVESWRPVPGRDRWISTRCGNTLGTDPASPPVQTYRPDGIPPQYTTSGEHG